MTDLAITLALIVFATWTLIAYWAVTTIADRLMWLVLEMRDMNDLLSEPMDEDELDELDEFDPADDWKKKVPES